MCEPTEKAEWIEYFEAKLKRAQQRKLNAIGATERTRFQAEVKDLQEKLWVMNLDIHRWVQSQTAQSAHEPSSL